MISLRKVKTAVVETIITTSPAYSVVCPNCKYTIIGGINKDTMMIRCYNCRSPIKLIFKDEDKKR